MNKLLLSQIGVMMSMQNDINSQIDPDWKTRGRPWYRAIWIECAELMDHAGYKWWKKAERDMAQIHLEIVDIWHFGLSIMVESGITQSDITEIVTEYIRTSPISNALPILQSTEDLASQCLTNKAIFPLPAFMRLMGSAAMTFNDLYVGYIGKNVLNKFRQDNGYKDGTYEKMWDGQEDNVHLVGLSKNLFTEDPDYPLELYKALQLRYNSCVG